MHIQQKWKVWMSIFLSPVLVALSLGAARNKIETPVVAELTTSTHRASSPTDPQLEKQLGRALLYRNAFIKHIHHQQQLKAFYISVQRQIQEKQEAAHERTIAAASEPEPSYPTPTGGAGIWWELAGCETGGKYDNPNTGNGYYGYFQFSLGTWRLAGGTGYPHQHSYEVQRSFAEKLARIANPYSQWPVCWPKAVS